MAFYSEEEIDEEGQDQGSGAPNETVGVGPTAIGPEAASLTPGATGAASASGPGKVGSFVGISDYINANKPQSEKLAGQVVENVESKAKTVDETLGGVQNSFNQAAESQKVQADDDLLNQVKTNAESITSDPNKVSSFTKQRDASYSGPKGLEDLDSGKSWAGLQSALKTAQGAKQAVGTEEGRMGLIKEISNNPRQSQGALTFDNLLLQSNPNAASKLQSAGSNLADVDQRINAAKQQASSKAQEIQAANAQISQKAKDAVQGGYEGLKGSLTEREAAKDAEQKAIFDKIRSALVAKNAAGGRIRTDQPDQIANSKLLQGIGLQPNYATQGYGVNPEDFLEYVDTANAQTVATESDLARQKALQQLAGGGLEDLLSSAAPLGGVGSGYNFKGADYSNAVSAKNQEYDAKDDALFKENQKLFKTQNKNSKQIARMREIEKERYDLAKKRGFSRDEMLKRYINTPR